MANKDLRQRKEMENLFSDPRFARQAWKAVGQAIAIQPAVKPIVQLDKDGNETYESRIQNYSYNRLAEDLKTLGSEGREPTELEMILHCQMMRARTDTSAAVFIRDTLGAKPVDESKMEASVSNVFENLSDEELELIAEHRRNASAQLTEPEHPTVQEEEPCSSQDC